MTLSRDSASRVSFLFQSGGKFSTGGQCIYLDLLPTVAPGKFWRVLNARIGIYSPTTAVSGLGDLWTGLFICPQGTQPPKNYGGLTTLPLRAPSSFPVGQQTINGYSDGKGDDAQSAANLEAAIDFDREFIVPENCFLRVNWSTVAAGPPPADSVVTLTLEYIEETKCP